jgi:hypothetical protein
MTVRALKARIAACLACLLTSKESLEGAVQPREHILQDLRVDGAVFGADRFDVWQFRALARLSDVHTARAPRLFAFFQGSVLEFTAATHDKRQRLLWGEFVLECLVYAPLVHMNLFCLIGTKAVKWKGHSSLA